MDESETLRWESQVKPLRLSEAIRIGARIRPQCTSDLFHNGKSCVLGAAYEGATGFTCGPIHSNPSMYKPELERIIAKAVGSHLELVPLFAPPAAPKEPKA